MKLLIHYVKLREPLKHNLIILLMDTLQFCNALQDCILTRELYETISKEDKPIKQKAREKKKIEYDIIVNPSQSFKGASRAQDTLFWCFLYLWKPAVYSNEIHNATFTREYELKCDLIKELEKLSKSKEKQIRTHGFRDVRITKSNGYTPRLSIKELIAECSGASVIRFRAFDSLMSYFSLPVHCIATVDYHDEHLGIITGNTLDHLYTYDFNKKYDIIELRRHKKNWFLSSQSKYKRLYFSGLDARLPSMTSFKKDDLAKWSDDKLTKKELYELGQNWISYRISILLDVFEK